MYNRRGILQNYFLVKGLKLGLLVYDNSVYFNRSGCPIKNIEKKINTQTSRDYIYILPVNLMNLNMCINVHIQSRCLFCDSIFTDLEFIPSLQA